MEEREPIKTWISDTFPLGDLECQYFDICKHYDPKKCGFNVPCGVRQDLREDLEDYVGIENLKMQIKLILKEKEK